MTSISPLMWAVVSTAPAAIAGFSVLFCAKLGYMPVSTAALLAGFLRLLLALAGSAIITYFVKLDILWFVLWLMILYFATLIFEVCFAIRIAADKNASEV